MAAQPTSPRLNPALTPAAQGTPPTAAPEATVHAVATVSLDAAPIVPAAALVGASTPAYNAEAKYQEAKRLLDANQKKDAKSIFNEIIRRADPKTEGSLLMACCKIGLAYTYDTVNVRSHLISEAKPVLDQFYTNRASWQPQDQRANYAFLIEGYNRLLFLLSRDEASRGTIQQNVKICEQEAQALASPIPTEHTEASPAPAAAASAESPTSPAPAAAVATVKNEPLAAVHPAVAFTVTYDADARFNKANQYLGQNNYDDARRVFEEIITNLRDDLTNVQCLLMTASCLIGAARTYNSKSDEGAKLYLLSQAKGNCDQIYEDRASWKEEDKLTTYAKAIKNYEDLQVLLPSKDPAREDIQTKLQICRKEFQILKSAVEPIPESPVPVPATPPRHPSIPVAVSPVSTSPASVPAAGATAPSSTAASLPAPSFDPPPPSESAPAAVTEPAKPAPRVTFADPFDAKVSGAEPPPSPAPQPQADAPESPPVVPPLPNAGLYTPRDPGQAAPTPYQTASPRTSPRKAAADAPKKVTPGPVGSSSRIRIIFGVTIAAILATVVGVVIYNRRWVVKK